MTIWKYHRRVPLPQRRTRAIYRKLDAGTVDALKALCHSRGLTVNAVLNSAMLLSAQRLAGSPIRSPLFSPVNLRNRTVPPVESDYLGCYLSVVFTSHPRIDGRTDLFELARDCHQKILSAIPRQTRSPREFDLSALEKMVENLVVSSSGSFNLGFSCSNMGEPEVGEDHGSHRLEAFYTVTNQSAGNFPMMLNVVTISGEMFFTFVYTYPLMSEDWAVSFVDRFSDLLLEALSPR